MFQVNKRVMGRNKSSQKTSIYGMVSENYSRQAEYDKALEHATQTTSSTVLILLAALSK